MRPVKGWRAYLEHCDEQLALGEPAEEGGAPTHKHPPAPTRTHWPQQGPATERLLHAQAPCPRLWLQDQGP